MAYRVLIIEDDPMVAMINQQYIQTDKNFSVIHICRNGMDALKFLSSNSVDLIILDVYMPLLNGIETLHKIRQQKIDSEVIMVTAASDASTIDETMHLGVMDYLIKPFTLDRLLLSLQKFIEKKYTLSQNNVLDQNTIDNLISKNTVSSAKKYPKGIQEKTLSTIKTFLNENSQWNTVEQISDSLGISMVTVRTYMNYLLGEHLIKEKINYNTGGRPSILYKITEQHHNRTS